MAFSTNAPVSAATGRTESPVNTTIAVAASAANTCAMITVQRLPIRLPTTAPKKSAEPHPSAASRPSITRALAPRPGRRPRPPRGRGRRAGWPPARRGGRADRALRARSARPPPPPPRRTQHRLGSGRDSIGTPDVDPDAAKLRLVRQLRRHRLDRDGRTDRPGGRRRLRRRADQSLLRPADLVQLQEPGPGRLVERP